MPSLKDLRNRISSPSRRRRRSPRPCRWLRRRNCVARRRRPKPRGPSRSAWRRCWAISPAESSAGAAPRCSRARGKRPDASSRRLHRRARSLRRLQLVHRQARARARLLAHQRKARRLRSFAWARRATTRCGACSSRQIIELIELRAIRQLGFVNAQEHRAKTLSRATRPANLTSARCSFRSSNR